VSVGPVNRTAPTAHFAATFPFWEATANTYNKRVEWYEGAWQPQTPSTATLSGIGVTVGGSAATANAALAAGLLAYKNNAAYGAGIINFYYSGFTNIALLPHSKTPSQLVLLCGGQYAFVSTCTPNDPVYQMYNGFKNFVGVSN